VTFKSLRPVGLKLVLDLHSLQVEAATYGRCMVAASFGSSGNFSVQVTPVHLGIDPRSSHLVMLWSLRDMPTLFELPERRLHTFGTDFIFLLSAATCNLAPFDMTTLSRPRSIFISRRSKFELFLFY
jgi:hypothetical protein